MSGPASGTATGTSAAVSPDSPVSASTSTSTGDEGLSIWTRDRAKPTILKFLNGESVDNVELREACLFLYSMAVRHELTNSVGDSRVPSDPSSPGSGPEAQLEPTLPHTPAAPEVEMRRTRTRRVISPLLPSRENITSEDTVGVRESKRRRRHASEGVATKDPHPATPPAPATPKRAPTRGRRSRSRRHSRAPKEDRICPVCSGPGRDVPDRRCKACYNALFNTTKRIVQKKLSDKERYHISHDKEADLVRFLEEVKQCGKKCSNTLQPHTCPASAYRFDVDQEQKCPRCRILACVRLLPDLAYELLCKAVGEAVDRAHSTVQLYKPKARHSQDTSEATRATRHPSMPAAEPLRRHEPRKAPSASGVSTPAIESGPTGYESFTLFPPYYMHPPPHFVNFGRPFDADYTMSGAAGHEDAPRPSYMEQHPVV